VTGVRGDAADLDDLDRLFDTVKKQKGKIDILFASAGKGEAAVLGEITEQHFDAAFGLNVINSTPNSSKRNTSLMKTLFLCN
jgi:NAD(P)-dependent dehydrogenase (short-subunit alcohol dehydrogenase family)